MLLGHETRHADKFQIHGLCYGYTSDTCWRGGNLTVSAMNCRWTSGTGSLKANYRTLCYVLCSFARRFTLKVSFHPRTQQDTDELKEFWRRGGGEGYLDSIPSRGNRSPFEKVN